MNKSILEINIKALQEKQVFLEFKLKDIKLEIELIKKAIKAKKKKLKAHRTELLTNLKVKE